MTGDDIERVVDRQLLQERSGYDNNINQSICRLCSNSWHGLTKHECPGEFSDEESAQRYLQNRKKYLERAFQMSASIGTCPRCEHPRYYHLAKTVCTYIDGPEGQLEVCPCAWCPSVHEDRSGGWTF